MSWKRPLWPATPSHSLHLHTFEYRYDSFFFFFFCIHAYERRSGNACFLPVLPTGFRLFDIKKVSETPPRGITRGFFLPTFQSPWFLTPIRIVFGGISRGCVWFYPIGSDSSIIDEFIPSPPLSRRRWYTHSREIDGESK